MGKEGIDTQDYLSVVLEIIDKKKMMREHGEKKQEEVKKVKSGYTGTIKIDCSGAYIANDHLFRDQLGSSSSSSSSPQTTDASSESETDDESGAGDRKKALPAADRAAEGNGGSSDPTVCLRSVRESVAYDLTKNITLPKHNSEVFHISVDIGGTLTKLVYFTRSGKSNGRGGGKLHFKDFQTGRFESEVLDFLIKLIQSSAHNKKRPPITYIMATGGGSHKFYDLMTDTFKLHNLPMKIVAKDEMECLIKGLNWLIVNIPNEIFTYNLEQNDASFVSNPLLQYDNNLFPYLLVNIGSGVSMIKVSGPGSQDFERIGGSSLGGGTLWGLLSLLTDAKDYNEMLEMAQRGNNENIDLLVGDIYGANYNKIGLKSSHIASSFAKAFKKLRFTKNSSEKPLSPAEKLAQFKQEDISRSLLYLISNNIGQIAYLQALRFNLKRIYFGGSYISGHKQTIHTLSFAVNFWSNGDMESYFLRHEGYLGSVGAFMMGPDGELKGVFEKEHQS